MNHKRMLIISFNILFLILLLSLSYTENQFQNIPLPDIKKIEGGENKKNTSYILIGSENGLYYWDYDKDPQILWKDGDVKKILKTDDGIYLLSSAGIVFTDNLKEYRLLNKGLIYKVIKHYQNGKKSFTQEIKDLKDIAVDPFNSSNLITCTKDEVFYSTDKGLTWKSFPNPTSTPGIKSVAIYSDNKDIYLFMGHPFRGVYYRKHSEPKSKWKEIRSGLYEYAGTFEEISDIVIQKKENGVEIYASHNFNPIIFKLNQKGKEWKWEQIFKMKEEFAVLDSLFFKEDKILFMSNQGLLEYNPANNSLSRINMEKITEPFEQKTKSRILSLFMVKDNKIEYDLSEMWLLSKIDSKHNTVIADNKRGLYIQADVARNKKRMEEILAIMQETQLNMIVIDMKDDFGNLRFNPENEWLKKFNAVKNPVNLEEWIKTMKEKNIYLVARIVVFKDKELYHYQNYRFAVKNPDGTPWRGIDNGKEKNEFWVDPYSEEVWEYNVAIAKELMKRGFDEIQFDYIRFPTDGDNLSSARYYYRDNGMDKESALISFLSYVRENISTPISVDIYGANGWHRTSARTGQDVELLQKYVDVICPMYYPSHFPQNFLYYPPYEKRPYLIYWHGSYRNYYIGRKNVVIRPYVQAFKMNVSYDREFYGPDYVMLQIQAIEDSIKMGYTFWNSSSKYSILLEAFKKIKNAKGKESGGK